MPKYLGVLLAITSGTVALQAASPGDQGCIDRGIQITAANDTAIIRARSSLELPEVRLLMVAALHLVKVAGQPAPPTFTPCMIFKDAHESGPGANITYRYEWRLFHGLNSTR
jgi:hypothetical protein